MRYAIAETDEETGRAYEPYGAALELWKYRGHEVIISGPAETGKTRAALEKLDAFCWKYPNLRALLVRKTYKSIKDSVLVSFDRKVLGYDAKRPGAGPVFRHGGEMPTFYEYPNGSRIVISGMDNADKVLSAEYDVVYVNQAEELDIDDWEKLSTRCTGRAGNMPYAQMMGDCNPGPSKHWILDRARAGSLRFLESRHEDNPVLFNQETGEITEQGRRTLAVLDRLTGARKERLRFGRWVQAEGVVYEGFDRRVHMVDPFDVPADWERIRAIDFGYTNPFVCQWWAFDEDRRMYLYREIYFAGRLTEDHARKIVELSRGEAIAATVCDHDAEDRKTLERHGVPNVGAYKSIKRGIEAVQSRLQQQDDGRPRLFISRNALVEVDPKLIEEKKPYATEHEFEVYVWPKAKDGKPEKEVPVDDNNHGMDALRYAVAWADLKRQIKGGALTSFDREDSGVKGLTSWGSYAPGGGLTSFI